MTYTVHNGLRMVDFPICEVCGETDAVLQDAECALCEDCFASTMSAALTPVLGRKVCGCPLWSSEETDRQLSICIEPYGVEHDHP